MELMNLPEEIIIIIIRQLDLKSIINLYNTCTYARKMVSMHGVIRECCLSLNTMATAQSFKLNFFKDISGHLLELNLCGVHDLNKSSLLPAVRKLKRLQTLNVAYTRITMLDFLDVYELCPAITNITIDFNFENLITQDKIARFQKIFHNIQNVHFVGNDYMLLQSGLSQLILQKAELNNLSFTVLAQKQPTFYRHEEGRNIVYKCNYFRLHWKDNFFGGHTHATRHMLDPDLFEFLVIMAVDTNNFTVYASQKFEKFLLHHFGISAECSGNAANKPLPRDFAMMAWDKKTTNFDDKFFSNLLWVVNKLFPCNYQTNGSEKLGRKWKTDRYYIRPTFQNETNSDNSEPAFKKRRVVPPNVVLNYDEMFQEEKTVRLNLNFDNQFRNPVTLPTNCNYLKKLTYLSLTGTVIYSLTFFNILFRCCDNLVTLNVEAPSISPCAAAISRSLPLTRTVKNLRLVDKRINFKTLFSSFSQCKTLENIHILDVSNECNEIADPSTMFENCDNLYYLLIYGTMSNNIKTIFNKAKARSRKYHLNLNIQIVSDHLSRISMNYDPFVSVFQLHPIND